MNIQDINYSEFNVYDMPKAIEAAILDYRETGKTIIFDEQIFRIMC